MVITLNFNLVFVCEDQRLDLVNGLMSLAC